MSEPTRTARLPSLDGLRAVAILLVLACHAIQTIDRSWPPNWWVGTVISFGPLGVRVFFVISGFLITRLLLDEMQRTSGVDLPRFYLRRTMRIFIPYYVFLAVVTILSAISQIDLSPNDLLHAATYTTNYHAGRSWWIGHTWSLSVEEQFYLLWPALLAFTGRRAALWGAAAVLLLSPVLRLIYYVEFPALIEEEIGYRFETVADALATGAVLAGALEWLRRQPAFERLRSPWFALVPVAVLLLARINQSTLASFLVGITLQNIGIAVCLAMAMTYPGGLAGRILNLRPLMFIGTMSYSIYLWQQIFLNPISIRATTTFPVNLGLVIVASLASYFLVERPSLRLRERVTARTTSKQVASVPAGPIPGGRTSREEMGSAG